MSLTVQPLVLQLRRAFLACALVLLAVGLLAVDAAIFDEEAGRAVLEPHAVASLSSAVGAHIHSCRRDAARCHDWKSVLSRQPSTRLPPCRLATPRGGVFLCYVDDDVLAGATGPRAGAAGGAYCTYVTATTPNPNPPSPPPGLRNLPNLAEHHGKITGTGPTDGHGIALPGLCARRLHDETNGPLFLPRQPQWRRGGPAELPNVIGATGRVRNRQFRVDGLLSRALGLLLVRQAIRERTEGDVRLGHAGGLLEGGEHYISTRKDYNHPLTSHSRSLSAISESLQTTVSSALVHGTAPRAAGRPRTGREPRRSSTSCRDTACWATRTARSTSSGPGTRS